jgi:hypothetical protein
MARHRYAACMKCRSEAQKVAGVTAAQQAGLRRGRSKGTNHRTGYKHREESKRQIAASNKAFWAAHPDLAVERGTKTRGELNHRWKGGVSRLNTSIRQMTENRTWADAVRSRDSKCVRCGSTESLEAHHKTEFADLIERLGINSRDDARCHAAILWALDNGEALCEACHYAEHGRICPEPHHRPAVIKTCAHCGTRFAGRNRLYCSRACSSAAQSVLLQGVGNPNYRSGRTRRTCLQCGSEFSVKPAIVAQGGGKFCGRQCVNENRRHHV